MSKNVQNFVKFQKFQLENLVDFEKCCKTRILNYFLAKIGADTAENEQQFAEILPIGRRVSENEQQFAEILPIGRRCARRSPRSSRDPWAAAASPRRIRDPWAAAALTSPR